MSALAPEIIGLAVSISPVFGTKKSRDRDERKCMLLMIRCTSLHSVRIGFSDMRFIACTTFAFLLMLDGFAANYDDLLKQGYRWVTVDGPYACVSVEDLRKVTRGGGDELQLKLVEQLKAYYLIQGTMVQVIKEDKSAGVSQIRIDGITTPLWTRNEYLSRHPLKSIMGRIETPTTSTPSGSPGESATPSGSPGENPTPGGSPALTASPTPSTTP